MPAEAIFNPSRAASVGQLAAQFDHLLRAHTRIAANLGAQLDDRLMHLRFDVLLQKHFAVGQDLLDMRTQLARLRIDDLKFLFDAEREDVGGRAH